MQYMIVGYRHGPYPVAFIGRDGDFTGSRHEAARTESYPLALAERRFLSEFYPHMRWTIVPMPARGAA